MASTVDIIAPREIKIPFRNVAAEQPTVSGSFFISGNYAYIRTNQWLLKLSGSNIL